MKEQFSAFDYSNRYPGISERAGKAVGPALLGGNSEEEMRIMIAWKEFLLTR
jgi:hypothetical protein